MMTTVQKIRLTLALWLAVWADLLGAVARRLR